MTNVTYTVVELAGYVGECDRKSNFKSAAAAWDWVHDNYDPEELDDGDRACLHIDVRRDPEGTYDF